jgi:PTS hybrid protein
MVGIVIVSHSRELADSIVEFTKMMAPEALIRAAGGMDDGTLGTSYEKIYQAIEVLVMMDMGSAVMTTEMVLEEMSDKKIEMIDCPIVEGAVAATVAASAGADFEEVKQNALEAKTAAKF